MNHWESVAPSAFLVSIFLVGSLPVIFFISRFTAYLVCAGVSRVSNIMSHFPSRKFAIPLTILLFSIELEVLSEDIQRSFSINDSRVMDFSSTLSILAFGMIAYRLFEGFLDLIYDRYALRETDGFSQRRMITQISYINKIMTVVIFLIVLGAILLRFESFEKIGGSLLASAGIASIVVGIAAQEPLSNLLAGFQIAFSQPLRIEDAVVVEGEFGTVEEINLSYIVVRLWDKRRLILPIKYFTSHSFENWTRNSTQVIGAIFLYLDYTVKMDELRAAFDEILDSNSKWDGDVKVLQVVDTTEKTVQIRALVSASDAATLWDLRCEVREGLIRDLQSKQSCSLPLERTHVRLTEKI